MESASVATGHAAEHHGAAEERSDDVVADVIQISILEEVVDQNRSNANRRVEGTAGDGPTGDCRRGHGEADRQAVERIALGTLRRRHVLPHPAHHR